MLGCRVNEKFATTERSRRWGIESDDKSRIEWRTVTEQVLTGTSSASSFVSCFYSARCERIQGLEYGLYDTSPLLGIRREQL